MFPLRDNIPAKHFPYMNLFIIIVNVSLFLYELSLGPYLDRFIMEFGFIPARFVLARAEGWLDPTRYLTIFTSMFLHGGWLHVISNMWMLWVFGDNVEDRVGHGRYLLFYFFCGVAAVMVQLWSQPLSGMPMIGASGAIAGVLGAYFLLYPNAKVLTLIPIFIFFYFAELPAFLFLGLWFFMQFLQGTSQIFAVQSAPEGGVAFWAHIGGFLSGLITILLFTRGRGRRQGRYF